MNPLVDHFLGAAAAGQGASPEATARVAAAFRACLWDARASLESAMGITARGGPGSLSTQGRRAARDGLLRETRLRLPAGLSDREAARAMLNVRDALKRRVNGVQNEIEDFVEAVILIGLPVPDEKQLSRIVGHRSD
jgi:hypothetical protein